MDEDEYDNFEPLPATQMQGIDVLILVLDCAGSVARVPGRFFTDLTELVCRHANWRVARKRMENEARMEIEMLVNGVTE